MVKSGYKQTEIGVIPVDWEVKELKDVTTLLTNGFVGIAKIHYTESDNGITYVQGFNVEENSFNFRGIKKVTNEFHLSHLRSSLKNKDLLTVQTGNVGLTTYVPKQLEGANCHALIISRYKLGMVESKYVSYYLNSNVGRNRLRDIETGTTMKHINVGDFQFFKIPLPPLAEQQAIAEALSDADAWIESLEQLIAKKRLLKHGAMQELLTPKEDWEVKKLGEMTSLITKGTTPTSVGYDFTENGINFIKVESITKNGKIDLEKTAFISEQCHQALSRSQIVEGDLLFSIAGALGRTAIVKNNVCPANTNQALGIIRINNAELSNAFLYYFINRNEFQLMLNTISVTGAQPNLSLKNLNEFEILFPHNLEQTRIATILSDMDLELEALEQQLEKARQIKQGMMQELLTGRIRLV